MILCPSFFMMNTLLIRVCLIFIFFRALCLYHTVKTFSVQYADVPQDVAKAAITRRSVVYLTDLYKTVCPYPAFRTRRNGLPRRETVYIKMQVTRYRNNEKRLAMYAVLCQYEDGRRSAADRRMRWNTRNCARVHTAA